MPQSLAITDATLVTMDPSNMIIEEGTVILEGGRIREILEGGVKSFQVDRVINGKNHVVLPGLINCHAHSRPARALGDGLPMEEWHRVYAEHITQFMDQEDSRVGSLVAFSECIRTGTTSVLDMTYKPAGAAEAANEVGIRATLVPLASDHPDMKDKCDTFEDNIALLETQANQSSMRVRFWVGCDSIVETSPHMLEEMSKASREYGVGVHTHMSEAKYDTGYIPEHFDGARGAEFLEEHGILGDRTVLAHCNWLTSAEIQLLASTGTHVAHCPTSNMRFGTGVCPVPALLEAGVNVALATDGLLSNFKLDMFEVMRGSLMLQRITHLDAFALDTIDALRMATVGGASALGQEDDLGTIEEGKLADLILIDLQDVKFSPLVRGVHDNLIPLLVWTASGDDVDTVLVNGEIIMEDRTLTRVDESKLIDEANQCGNKILNKVPVPSTARRS